jgi:hypothetical protein
VDVSLSLGRIGDRRGVVPEGPRGRVGRVLRGQHEEGRARRDGIPDTRTRGKPFVTADDVYLFHQGTHRHATR